MLHSRNGLLGSRGAPSCEARARSGRRSNMPLKQISLHNFYLAAGAPLKGDTEDSCPGTRSIRAINIMRRSQRSFRVCRDEADEDDEAEEKEF